MHHSSSALFWLLLLLLRCSRSVCIGPRIRQATAAELASLEGGTTGQYNYKLAEAAFVGDLSRLKFYLQTAGDSGGPMSPAEVDNMVATRTADLRGFTVAEAIEAPVDTLSATALHWAVSQNRTAAARMLLDHGADPNQARSDGRTALMDASIHLPTFRLLLERGANPDAVDSATGWSAFHLTTIFEHMEAAELLIAYRCNMNLRDKNGLTGWDYALHLKKQGKPGLWARLSKLLAPEGSSVSEQELAATVKWHHNQAREAVATKLIAKAIQGKSKTLKRLLAQHNDPDAIGSVQTWNGVQVSR